MNKKFKDSWESTLPEVDFTFKSAVMLKVKHISHNIHGSSAVSAIAKNLTYLNAPESSGHRTHCSELAACDQSSVPDRRSLWPSLCLHALHVSFFCGAVVFSCCSFIQLLFFFLHFPCVCVSVCTCTGISVAMCVHHWWVCLTCVCLQRWRAHVDPALLPVSEPRLSSQPAPQPRPDPHLHGDRGEGRAGEGP